ncbi:MAG: csbC [Actinomycetia bacterium]|jgi:isochorismate synthase|nr:csbC [Actinomycetes bacterium]
MNAPLAIRSRPLGPVFDLLALHPDAFVFERSGLGVAALTTTALGGADVATLGRQALTLLRGHDDAAPDAPPFVVASLPFRPSDASEVLVPHRSVRRTASGATWLLDAAGDSGATFEPEPVAGRSPHDVFTDVQLSEHPSSEDYREAVAGARSRIRNGALRKVVLARTVDVDAGRSLDPRRLAHRLRAVDPDAYTFVVPLSAGEAGPRRSFVGASPELLLSRWDREVRSNPLAGSAPRSGDPAEDRANAEALSGSSKDREEHEIVVEAVAETLRPFCTKLTWDPEPVLRETPNVWHLSTRFHGVLTDAAPSALDLVAALHPTPAVGGTPQDVALDAISDLEPFDRGRYAGPVGWMDAHGDGEWAIALRCAELLGDRAVLYAGAGIVAGSEPEAEVDETERKFRAFLDALRWG